VFLFFVERDDSKSVAPFKELDTEKKASFGEF